MQGKNNRKSRSPDSLVSVENCIERFSLLFFFFFSEMLQNTVRLRRGLKKNKHETIRSSLQKIKELVKQSKIIVITYLLIQQRMSQ